MSISTQHMSDEARELRTRGREMDEVRPCPAGTTQAVYLVGAAIVDALGAVVAALYGLEAKAAGILGQLESIEMDVRPGGHR